MGYIKKLKNNELVGGTDKTTIYPVTSTEAVFEEVSENNFKSQKYLNNHIYGGEGGRINQESITNYNIAKGTLSEDRLDTALKTKVQEGYDTSWKFKGEYDKWATYDAHDVVYDTATNSSYISLQADNQWHPVNPEDEAYVEGWWQVIMDGKVSTDANNALVEYIENDLTQHVTDAISDANGAIQDMIDSAQDQLDTKIAEAQDQLDATTQEASDAAIEARDAASTVESLTSQQVADAQIGYFECTNTAASGTATNETKITTTDTIGVSTYTKTVGSHVKVKMAVANTHAAPVYLQFGSNTANKAQLYYNGEPVSISNSWEDGETISVYYDGTYYQASNAQGGGSAVGKKKLTGSTGYVSLVGAVAPNPTTSGSGVGNYRYIQYPVKEGDVIEIRGIGNGNAWTWGLIDSERNIIESSGGAVNYTTTPFLKVIPSGVDYIIINNLISTFPNYEWYFAKKGSVGAHEMLTEAYLYGDWRILSTGQTYTENEAVKTTENQLLKVTKAIVPMTITDTVVVGDVKVFDNGVIYGTYKAQKAVSAYNGTETEGLYAIGRPSISTITVDATSLSIEEDTDITVTIGESTQTITVPAAESETKAADIAALIAAAFTSVPGWTLADNEDGTLTLKCNTGGANTIVVSSEVGETGLVITSTAVNGADTLSQYNEGVWEDVAIADYAADAAEIGVSDDTKMWQKLSVQDIINSYTTQNNISSSLDDIGTYETTETLIFNRTTMSAGAGATNAYLTVPVNFMVGNKYKIVATLSRTINTALTSYLRQSPGSSTGITLSGLSIPAGQTKKEYYYEPKEGNNYQYFDRYAKTTYVITVNYKVYLLGSKTVKKKVEELADKVENIKVEDIQYGTSTYTNANNDFTWQTGNPSNPQYPTTANKYFVLDVGKKIKKLHVYKASSDLYMLTAAYVNGSYISIGVPIGLSVNSTVDLTDSNYSKIYCLLYRQGGQATPTTTEAKAQTIELTCDFALDGAIDSLDDRITELETSSGGLEFTNPIIRTDYPDPAIWWGEDGYWYAFSTGAFATRTMYRSANLVHWENTGEIPFTENAVSTMVGFNKTSFWAAEVVKIGDHWNMYLSTTESPLFVFTSNQPTCGFEYVKCLIANQTDSGFVNNDNNIGVGQNIDPCVRIDRENRVWLFWGSLDKIWRVRLTDDGLSLLNKDKEHAAGLDGGQDAYRNNVYEGAYLYRRKGYWYLFVSAGGYRDQTYCIKVGRCQTLDGTFVDKEGNLMTEGHATLIMSSPNTTDFYGTGHNGPIITDKDNRTWIFFHSHWKGTSSGARPMCISEVLWDENGWPYFVNDTLTVSGVGPRM